MLGVCAAWLILYPLLVASMLVLTRRVTGLSLWKFVRPQLPIVGATVFMAACVLGVQHMLAASRHAAYCLPVADQAGSTPETRELDHLLAAHLGWWDVLVEGKRPFGSARGSLQFED